MRIRFWGTRGSIATPGPSTVRYGGNTSCVELRSDGGTLVVIDCGTGARLLGNELLAAAESRGEPTGGTILLGHTHWDHIQGLPFFEPLFRPGRWDVYGPRGLGTSLDQTLAGQMNYQYFPVALDQLGADIEYHELVEGTFVIDDLVVRTRYLNHPALTLGFRIEGDGAVFCYLADHEPFDPALGGGGDVLASPGDAHHVEFLRGADVLVHDAQYTAEEYPSRVGWGHSTVPYVVDVACAGGVARTILYHHDPSHDDAAIDAAVAAADVQAAGRTTVTAAAEGDVVEIVPVGGAVPPRGGPDATAAAPPVADVARRVVVVTSDAALREMVAAAAAAEHLEVVDGVAPERAVAPGAMLVIDVDDRDARARLSVLAAAGSAVVAVTRSLPDPARAVTAVTDWLVWPASAAHVRTKLRSAVLRRACRWTAAPLPPDEVERLDALRGLGVLDTAADPRFDRFTEDACTRFRVPIALITLVDRDRQWFKSHRGFDYPESPRDESFCAHAILGTEVMQVPDALADPRFAENPAVVGPPRIRFYAGAPVILSGGSRIGTLCIADHRPRLLDDDELAELQALADAVATALAD
jgi:phosphoribosyl 1,2-cyclic phosphodiesterase